MSAATWAGTTANEPLLAPADYATPAVARDTIPLVRQRIRQVLTHSPAFSQLSAEQRRELAQAMVNVGQYLVDAGGMTRDMPLAAVVQAAGSLSGSPRAQGTEAGGVARGLADPPPRPDTAGAKFKDQGGAVAAEAGVDQFGELVDKVDFPKFVAGLIDGVFNAIVDSSIRQMEAFAELVKNVSKSVDSFMKDNVSEDQARDYLVDRYPDHLQLDPSGGQPTVAVKPDADSDALPDFFKDLGMDMPVDSVDDETAEQMLVPAARKKMAMDRQQVLLTMVLMGLNRLVVTDGSIKAAVIFDLSTRDKITKHRERTNDYKHTTDSTYATSGWRGWFRPYSYNETQSSNFTVHTVNTEDSEARVDLKAKLSGDVNIRFKSETFPLDQMTKVLGVEEPKSPARPAAPAAQAGAPVPQPLPAGPAPRR